MKAMTCEMCGSNEFVKEDGLFVCQSCGIKYSLEDAKRMMIEGTVDVQGTVKVDNSAFVAAGNRSCFGIRVRKTGGAKPRLFGR